MLSVYVKELSREFKPKEPPETNNIGELNIWARKLSFARSDMQNAVQVLGKLRAETGHPLDQSEIDLSETNLQGFALYSHNLEKTSFLNARMEGANLSGAKLQEAYLLYAELQRAHFTRAELQCADLPEAKLLGANLTGAGFDSRTTLSDADFSNAALSDVDFSETKIAPEQLDSAFGDASVILPNGKGPNDPEWPAHWSKVKLPWTEFHA
jgi:uncharacterized protein YjbI with pentapeptide repeats